MREETRCRHMGYSFRLTARVLLYAPSHRQDSTYHSLCYTSRGSLAGKRNSSMGPPHEGSIRRPIAPPSQMIWVAMSCRGAAGLYSVSSNTTINVPKQVELLKGKLKCIYMSTVARSSSKMALLITDHCGSLKLPRTDANLWYPAYGVKSKHSLTAKRTY